MLVPGGGVEPPTRGEPRRILRAWKRITCEYSRLLLSASDAVFRDMQITVQYVGDMLCEACSRHSGDTTRFVRKDLSFGTVRRATVFEPTRKTSALGGQLRRT